MECHCTPVAVFTRIRNVDDLFALSRGWEPPKSDGGRYEACVMGSRAGRGGSNLMVVRPSQVRVKR